MRDADVAMYRAKADGKGRHAVFDAAMHEQVMRRLDLEGDLRRAIEDACARGRLSADRAGGDRPRRRLRGARAAGRTASPPRCWRWPTRPASPSRSAARCCETACAQLAEWRALPRGRRPDDRRQRLRPPARRAGLRRDAATTILRETGLDPRALRLEVSEHDLSRGRADDATRRVLEQALEQAGVRTHIDDFGTGASPLRLLHRFPGDAIKISRALVAGIGHDAGAFEIVRAVVGLAHNLGLEVIADGVEKREQLDYLKVLGCEFAQGFHISAPLSGRGGAGAAGEQRPPASLGQ